MRTPSLIAWAAVLAFCAPALAGGGKTITVAGDGSGDFKTVQEAVAAVPDNSADRTVIHIKPGTYQGPVAVPKGKRNVTFKGEDAGKTVITYDKNVYDPIPPGVDKFNPAVQVLGDDFRAEKITFRNTAGDRGQALAMKIDSDRVVLEDCRLLGWQDTLMVNNGRQYFIDCYVEGRVDFIYGSGTAVFDGCHVHSKDGGYVTAASTPQDRPHGFVFLNCKLTGDDVPWKDPAATQPAAKPNKLAYLGRPWRAYASVTLVNCELGDHVRPEGWHNWGNPENEKTARYAEYKCTGPGADRSKRVPWSKELTDEEARDITVEKVLAGSDGWVPHRAAQPAARAAEEEVKSDAKAKPEAKVRIVLAGDSTVTDDAGWGGAFAKLLTGEVECINLAKGGRSSGSFVAEGRWKKCLELKPDYVLVQFGHNDQPGHGPERETDPKTTYRENMVRYVKEARSAGIKPVLVTSLTRREFGPDRKIHSGLAPYAEAVKEVAAELDVPLVDLHARSIDLCERLGPDGCNAISPRKEGGGYDGTHLNEKGGELVAPLVAEELGKALPDLKPYIKSVRAERE